MKFTKMHGTGNDFVVINAMEEKLPQDMSAFSRKVADRHFGVGCDQVLVIDKSETADFKMLIYNADGSEVEMCGNGIRCLAKYVYEHDLTEKKELEVETLAGIIRPEIVDDGKLVRVDMGEPRLKTKDWLFDMEKVVGEELKVDDQTYKITLVSMGNPHCIVFVNEITDDHVLVQGPKFENHKKFPYRINTEFVKVINRNEVDMRVWERGSAETLACGTGASAVGVACMLNDLTEKKITVHLLGGNLKIEWAEDNHVYMTGPAIEVFTGDYFKFYITRNDQQKNTGDK